jgi:hypothetical protein
MTADATARDNDGKTVLKFRDQWVRNPFRRERRALQPHLVGFPLAFDAMKDGKTPDQPPAIATGDRIGLEWPLSFSVWSRSSFDCTEVEHVEAQKEKELVARAACQGRQVTRTSTALEPDAFVRRSV